MDLLAALRSKVATLEEGDHTLGLKAVLQHIDVALRHFERGQANQDDTAFTDVIYRTNQAFEGSVKEAYRVLAACDPAGQRPYDIERHLETSQLIRPRVLKLLSNYRTEWRNPSAHDYKLDFDESESLLAIFSVGAFAYLLIDLIAEHLSFLAAQAQAERDKAELSTPLISSKQASLEERVTEAIKEFCRNGSLFIGSANGQTEAQLIGALHGFLVIVLDDLKIEAESAIKGFERFRPDLFISDGTQEIFVEVKRYSTRNRANAENQMLSYLSASGFRSCILLFAPGAPGELVQDKLHVRSMGATIHMLRPSGSKPL